MRRVITDSLFRSAVLVFLLSSATTAAPLQDARPPIHRGKITGVVVHGVTGRPISGASVGVGDFGDSGGSNYARHREQGLHDASRTGADGRFELDGLAFTGGESSLKSHPLVVTHPDFAPHRVDVALPADRTVDVTVKMTPAAAVRVTALGEDGKPLAGLLLLRLEALDGHRFIPPGRDRHLSSFASSTWSQPVRDGRFMFTELRAGEYAIDAIRLGVAGAAIPGYGGPVLAASSTRFHGRVASVRARSGAAAEVEITPADHGTRLIVKIPEFSGRAGRPSVLRSPFVVISRNAALPVWTDGRARSPEDARLGRIQKHALISGFVPGAATFAIENLPPGTYSVLAGPVVLLRGAKVDLAGGADTTVEIPSGDPQGPARVDLGRLDRRVALEARPYRVAELCELMTRALESRPALRPAPALRDLTVTLTAGEITIWDLVEKLHLERNWGVTEEGQDVLALGPVER